MAAHVRTVVVPEADRRELQRRARAKGAPAWEVERAPNRAAGRRGDAGQADRRPGRLPEATVVTWRRRYAERGLAGLEDLRLAPASRRSCPRSCGIGCWS